MANDGLIAVFTNFSNGYIVEYARNESDICKSWLLLPAENLWSVEVRAFLYIIGMIYLFIGVAIGSDVFMTSIEVITSKKRKVSIYDKRLKKLIHKDVLVWNETVANLTLLALGSSAPEILLATVEAINEISSGNFKQGGGIGFYTILGSAAFNLLIITAICIMSVEAPNIKKLRLRGVFLLTAIWSLMAYIWLLAVIKWITPGVIDIWEAVVTLIFFPIFVLMAYAQDHNWWLKKVKFSRTETEDDASAPKEMSLTNGDAKNNKIVPFRSPDLSKLRRVFRGSDLGKGSKTNDIAIDVMESSVPAYKPFARARFRHAAIRAIGGGGVRALSNAQTAMLEDDSQPKLLTIVAKVAETNKIYKGKPGFQMNAAAAVSFASPSYSVMEDAGTVSVDVLLHRRRRLKSVATIATTSEDGKFDEKEVKDAVSVEYETREASAVANKDFKFTAGQLIFNENTYLQTISVPIINDDQYNPDTDFYIILKNPIGDVCLGDPSVCRVTIIDDDKPGDFVLESSQLYADMQQGVVQVVIMRQNGSDGKVSVDYATVDGTATGGSNLEEARNDYVQRQGTLEFKHNEESKTIPIFVNKETKAQKNFVFVLRNPSTGSKLGENSAAVINLNTSLSGMLVRGTSYLVDSEDNTWIGQLRGAMAFGKEVNENGEVVVPGKLEYILHFFAFLWKILFALLPPATTWGGYPSFILSLLAIGAITAVIEQLATLLACVVNVRDAVTGVCFIAIGTSVPDTFASRTAALHDDYADASIGNITGSNSVNVFLGLGLPWLIRAIYAAANNSSYTVNSTDIDFAVYLFDSFGAVCIVLLIFRRYVVGGELGGTRKSQLLSSGFLLLLWLIYAIVLSLKSYNYY